MPTKRIAAAALLIAAPFVSAGTVEIVNNCDFEVYVTPSQLGTDKPTECFQPGDSFTAPIAGEAVDLKIKTTPGFCFDDCVQLEYTRGPADLWYDLSNINAKAMSGFVEYGISVETSDPEAPKVNCPPGKDQCSKGVYNEWWQNEATFCSRKPDSDLTMHLCLSGKKDTPAPIPKPHPKPIVKAPTPPPVIKAPPPPPPPAKKVAVVPPPPHTTLAPSYVPAPKVHEANIIGENPDGSLDLDAKVVMVTDIVTETVFVKRAEATEAPMERRNLHRHAHAHGHSA